MTDVWLGSVGGPSQIGLPANVDIWFDGSDTTAGTVNGNQETVWDVGSAPSIDEIRIRWAYGGLLGGGAAGPFQIWGSNTGLTGPWTSVLTDSDPVGALPYPGDFEHTYTISPAVAYRYWRFRSTAGTANNDIFTVAGIGATPPVTPPDGEDGGTPSELPEKEDDPGAAILEVWVMEEGAPVWDVALWDDSWIWGEGGWRDITPQGVVADIHWGSDQASYGILAPTSAAVWNVTTYDPERVLDPANADGPAYPDIVPFLPIRLRHRSATIATGYVESITYDYADGTGLIRGTDNIARMAAADVPPDQIPFLSDQLHQRSRDAILAAGLDIYVPFGNAPWGPVELSPLADGQYTVWQIIAQSALEALYIPYLGNDGRLLFRPYAYPVDRGTVVAADELVGLAVQQDHAGLYSAVAVTDYSDGSLDIVHAITPTPVYGKRLYSRSPALTILGAQWADAVLADRGAPALRLVPGRIRPLTATRVETYVKVAPMDTVQISHTYTDPAVESQGRVLGIRVRVESHGPGKTEWQWFLDTASAGVGPLIADDTAALVYLIDDEDSSYLYPDGIIVTEAL